MKTSQVFKQAKKYLWTGDLNDSFNKSSYICHAISDVGYIYGRHYHTPYERAKCFIQFSIAPHYDLEDWVRANVKGAHKVLNKAGGAKQLQAYRQRWLDALIKEFEAKGD